jgi:hypothetical protein
LFPGIYLADTADRVITVHDRATCRYSQNAT